MQTKKAILIASILALGLILAYGVGQTLPPGWGDDTGRDRKQAAAILVCNMPGSTVNPNIVENISNSSETPNIQIGDDCATAIAQLLTVSFKLVEVRNLLALTQLYVFRK
jgi:hypothetical protein